MTQLRQRMLEDMQIRNFSENTQQSYLMQVSLFARHFRRSPEGLGPVNIRTYQVYMTNEKKLAPGSISIATAALRFLYTVTLKRPWDVEEVLPMPKASQTLPIILSPEEVQQFLSCVPRRKGRTVLTVCYAAGLRISEAVALKPTDIDSQRMMIRVEQGKGQKDRYVMLSEQLLKILRDWYRFARPHCLDVSWRHSRLAYHARGRSGCVSVGTRAQWADQTGDAAQLASRLRLSPA
jgi:site-specific recombinase XerD